MKRIALLSDTHNLLRPEVVEAIAGVERIVHCGDFCDAETVARLEAIAPLHGVRGNCDFGPFADKLPHTAVVDLFGAQAYLVHDIGHLDLDPAAAGCRFVFYGHSHRPSDETRDGVRYVNPGSIGPRRFDLPIAFAFLREDLELDFVQL